MYFPDPFTFGAQAPRPRFDPDKFITSNPAASLAFRQRNTALDWLFYDIGNLSDKELSLLVGETNLEGSIIVVWPEDSDREQSVEKFEDYESFRAEPGDLLEHFTIAGVGSSDVGAASLARTVANHVGKPVGAIVAGYGVADLIDEALGGWFALGTANRIMQFMHRIGAATASEEPLPADMADAKDMPRTTGSTDSDSLLRLLLDKERHIKTISGHSKGCLSIAYALSALVAGSDTEAKKKAKTARITTLGAVVEFPAGFKNVEQYLGSIDWFGGMNSRQGVKYTACPGAWHHLNTALPSHMDFGQILASQQAGAKKP